MRFSTLRALPALLCLAAAAAPLSAQQRGVVRVSGYVRSAESGEVIRGATVLVENGPWRAETNQDGFYVLTVPGGRQVLRFRALGHTPLADTLELAASLVRDVRLQPAAFTLQELRASGRRDSVAIDLETPAMSVEALDAGTIRLAPAILGEVDPIRTLTLLPGVKLTSDGSTGISVRGGTPDQNLILLDESTIYNPSHVFGFYSVFNSDAVADVKLYKGGIPARFGGRLSSVLDIRQREGNDRAFTGQASLGLISSRASVEGPLPGKLGSFLVAARRTYADLFLRLSSNPDINQNTAYFYDLNAKGNIRLGDRGSIMVSGYFGRDRFAVQERLSTGWGNTAGTLRWNQSFGDRLFSKVSLTSSEYDYRLDFLSLGRDLGWTASIGSTEARVLETLYLSNTQQVEFGGELIRNALQPGNVQPIGQSPVRPVTLQPRFGWTSALHADHEFSVSPALSVRYGVRWAGFRRVGAGTTYQYAAPGPVVYDAVLQRYQRGTIVDSTVFGPGETITSASGLEPRLALNLRLSRTASLKASVMRTRQFLHLISNTNSPTPLDVWEPVGPYFPAQRADQVALGYAGTFGDGAWELTTEAYVKRLDRVTDFVPGADLALNDRLETETLIGRGRAYGFEVQLRKVTGKLTGWISYTLSRSERRLPGIAPGDPGVNGGRWFPSPYDRTHDLAVVGFHPVGRSWTLSSVFVLTSGLPATFPVSRYQFNSLLLFEYGDRNAARLPTYHRLDVTLTKEWKRSQLQFGVYNLYNRFNAQGIGFRQAENDALRSEATQTALFGLVPSISYQFRF
ncbi:MAG: carboxypeptidase-like regulatory domain-containing protein [Gemmatimonadales bacterium]|nr:carboxypeptidase-like regulatory domain-containing protein [Gemmatimonadales bacterium]